MVRTDDRGRCAATNGSARHKCRPRCSRQNVHRFLGSGDARRTFSKASMLSIACAGEYVSIVGAAGSGKSTLLYLLGGLDRPTKVDEEASRCRRKRVFIDGANTHELSDVELATVRNEKIGFVFQFHYLLKEFTAAGECGAADVQARQMVARRSDGAGGGIARAVWHRVESERAGRIGCPAVSSSGWRSPGPWRTSLPCCWRMNRPEILTERTVILWPISSRASPPRGRPSSWSRMTSARATGRRMVTMEDGMVVDDR